MKKHIVIALGLSLSLAGTAIAAPVVPRDRVRIGTLESVDHTVLDYKPVVLANGQYLGWVENVDYIGNVPSRIKVTTADYRRSVWLFREDIKYDAANNVVVTSRTSDQIAKVSFNAY